jgi:D-alanine-D-alanine ligase
MKIGITYNLRQEDDKDSRLPVDNDEEFDSPDTIDAIAGVLEGAGHQVTKLGYGRDFVVALLNDPPDLVFHIAEGVSGRSRESQIPALLEMLEIPYTGSDPLALGLTLDKDLAKRIAASHGLATPRHLVAEDLPSFQRLVFDDLRFPLIVKPAHEGSSKGIRLQSRVVDDPELRKQAAWLFDRYGGPVMVEEFLEGEEFTVGVIGNTPPRPLGVMMIRHRFLPAEDFIYSLEVKRDWENQVEYLSPPPISDSLLAAISELATGVYSALGCRDVARVDIRLREGKPHFIEVNPLPGLSPEYGDLVIMARKRGVTYEELVLEILRHARERIGR